jgi:hypothetical protein
MVDIGSHSATVEREPALATPSDLVRAVAAAGYELRPFVDRASQPEEGRTVGGVGWRPIAFGLAAALALFGVYLGLATLAQGWGHALLLFAEDGGFVLAIAAGFGVQAGLFAHLRAVHARASGRALAATGGTGTATMLACCVHHLADVAPLVGLAGVATVLGAYRVPLLWLGVVSNGLGIAYLLFRLRRCAAPGNLH